MREIASEIRAWLPDAVALGTADLRQIPDDWPGEVVPNAVFARRLEFSRGRAAAREAMRVLGLQPAAIPIGADRAPVWPKHVVGSISHCEGACLALVARQDDLQSCGIDVEPLVALPEEYWDTVLRPEERQRVDKNEITQQGVTVLQYFVAKEAAYKAQFPISKTLLDFDALQITFTGQSFVAEFMRTVGEFKQGRQLNGRIFRTDNFLAGIVILQ